MITAGGESHESIPGQENRRLFFSSTFHTENSLYGVTIRYMGIKIHFEDEHGLWELLHSLCKHTQQQDLIKEAAAKLIA
ncbi:hypothetical protein Ga0123461_2012 [Mariprofundus aestuarium]|uniref:Uncharacterized protein n=1 Tax=Mariprofundus aestuarium TaxID=1921086 RepID=A0A2K8KZI7_MARES|nr:hypothetical protein [Mariprofundus aestuarium]ATX80418.1 hypothetical protein Ga0123461_2012 [Mariprofundus aestuarium]